jgi:hypothetical protein
MPFELEKDTFRSAEIWNLTFTNSDKGSLFKSVELFNNSIDDTVRLCLLPNKPMSEHIFNDFKNFLHAALKRKDIELHIESTSSLDGTSFSAAEISPNKIQLYKLLEALEEVGIAIPKLLSLGEKSFIQKCEAVAQQGGF